MRENRYNVKKKPKNQYNKWPNIVVYWKNKGHLMTQTLFCTTRIQILDIWILKSFQYQLFLLPVFKWPSHSQTKKCPILNAFAIILLWPFQYWSGIQIAFNYWTFSQLDSFESFKQVVIWNLESFEIWTFWRSDFKRSSFQMVGL